MELKKLLKFFLFEMCAPVYMCMFSINVSAFVLVFKYFNKNIQ